MQTEIKKYLKIGTAAFIFFLAVYYWTPLTQVIGVAFKAASPLVTGCIIAYIVNILMSFYEKFYFPNAKKAIAEKSRRPVCMLGAFATVICIIAIIMRLVVPELTSCVKLLFSEVPGAMKYIVELLSKSDWIPPAAINTLKTIDWNSMLEKIFGIITSGIGSTVNFAVSAVATVLSSITNLVIGIIFAIYLLAGKERLLIQLRRILKNYSKPAVNEKLHYILSVLNDCFHKYIVGQCTEAVILGILCAVGMMIFKFPYAMMTGAVIGVTALIPIAGAYIGGAVGFLLILSESPMKAILFVVYLIILQQLENNLIYPRVVGTSIGLPGIWVLVAVTVGGGIFGVTGMLLGVPLAAALYRILRTDMNKREYALKSQRRRNR